MHQNLVESAENVNKYPKMSWQKNWSDILLKVRSEFGGGCHVFGTFQSALRSVCVWDSLNISSPQSVLPILEIKFPFSWGGAGTKSSPSKS